MRNALVVLLAAGIATLGGLFYVASGDAQDLSTDVATLQAQTNALGNQLVKERAQNDKKVARAYAAGYAKAKRQFVLRDDVTLMIRTSAVAFGISPDEHYARAKCESRLDPNVVNPTSGVGGLFQFEPTTWTGQTRLGAAGFSVFDPLANSLGAAQMISEGKQSQWDCNASGVAKSAGGAPT